MRSKLIVAALLLASVTSAQAQWNTMPQYSIGASRGQSVSTPQAIAPGTTGRPMTSQGAAAYPAFSAALSNMTSINGVNVPSAGSFFATTTGTETLTNKSMAGSANTFTVIPNSALVNSATTVNGQSCVLGSTCTISASAGSITVGVTTIASGVSGRLLINSAGVLGDIATSGSGNVALTTNPVFVGPNLGTPSAVTLTNGTGLLISGISGLGTGVGTALGVNVGSAGAVVINGGGLGTPSSGTLTNTTGFPAANLAGLGTGVATALAASLGTTGSFPQLIGKGTAVLGTASISSGTCATAVTVASGSVATTDFIDVGFNSDPTGVTGYAPTTTGMLTIMPYPTVGNVNFKVCNTTASPITPGALTLNWSVRR